MTFDFSITMTDAPSQDLWQQVWDGLAAYNLQFAPADEHQQLVIFVHDADKKLIGGLLGGTAWEWLYINIFWLDESVRRQRLGEKILQMVEQEAIRRGCRHAYFDTLSFQARGFYEKYGYVVFAELDDFPPGHKKYFMKKDLIPEQKENHDD